MRQSWKHLENAKQFGIPAVVAINRFSTIQKKNCSYSWKMSKLGVEAIDSEVWAKRWRRAGQWIWPDLSTKIADEWHTPLFQHTIGMHQLKKRFLLLLQKFMVPPMLNILLMPNQIWKESKISRLDKLPICVAKTQNHYLTIRIWSAVQRISLFMSVKIEVAAGAGFIVPLREIWLRTWPAWSSGCRKHRHQFIGVIEGLFWFKLLIILL